MDKVEAYSKILTNLLEKYADISPKNSAGLHQQVIIDRERHHYQLLLMGWKEDEFVFRVIFHFDLIEDKVWLQRNTTDILIADELVEVGVSKEDIVLGFQPAYVRPHTGFAAA